MILPKIEKEFYKDTDKIEEILLNLEVDEKTAKAIINLKSPANRLYEIREIPKNLLLYVYAYCNLETKRLTMVIANTRGLIDIPKIAQALDPFYRIIKRRGVDIKDMRILRGKKKKEKGRDKFRKDKSKADKMYESARNLISCFNIPSHGLEAKLEAIKKDGIQSNEEYVKELYILREVFMAKAKGDIATTQTEALWEVESEEGKEEIVKKKIYTSEKGKQTVTIKTQSHLPDVGALVAVKILDDMILTAETRNTVELTEEEQTERYIQNLQRANREKEAMLERAKLLIETSIINGNE